ncbi:MAG: hypothetical protein IPF57_18040 [Gammaproteobacteria bacterium]|nr:hypothetical protein [Gammaproteobacteria bacterium]
MHWIARLDERWLGSRLAARVRRASSASSALRTTSTRWGYTPPEEDHVHEPRASGYWIVELLYLGDPISLLHRHMLAAQRRRMMNFAECVRRQLYMNGGDRIHLSKNPTFCGRVETLLEVFPDASVVLYRNPAGDHSESAETDEVQLEGAILRRSAHEKPLGIPAEMSFHNYTYLLEVLARRPRRRGDSGLTATWQARPRDAEQACRTCLVVSPEPAARRWDAEEQRAGGHETTRMPTAWTSSASTAARSSGARRTVRALRLGGRRPVSRCAQSPNLKMTRNCR